MVIREHAILTIKINISQRLKKKRTFRNELPRDERQPLYLMNFDDVATSALRTAGDQGVMPSQTGRTRPPPRACTGMCATGNKERPPIARYRQLCPGKTPIIPSRQACAPPRQIDPYYLNFICFRRSLVLSVRQTQRS